MTKQIDMIIAQTNGSMTISGLPLTNEDKERIRRCAGNDKLLDAEILTLVKKHSVATTISL